MSIVKQPGLVNSQSSTFSDPGFSSSVGAVSGCGGSVNSADALKQTGMYEVIKTGGAKKSSNRCKCNCHNCYCRGKCSSKCRCKCHKCMLCGKRNRKGGKKSPMNGGNGFGFSKNQFLSSTSGVNSGDSIHLASFTGYQNKGIDSDTNMGASSQSGGGSGYGFGSGGIPYYSYNPSEGEKLSTFAGSGYPPISRQLNNQCITPPILVQGGGKRRKSRNGKKSKKERKSRNGKKFSRKLRGAGNGENTPLQFNVASTNDLNTSKQSSVSSKNTSIDPKKTHEKIYFGPNPKFTHKTDDSVTTGGRKKKSMKRRGKKSKKSRRQRGGSGQYMNNIAYSHIYSTGAPPSLGPNESMLASPPPFTPKNDCMNSWKHLGDTPPYNEVYM